MKSYVKILIKCTVDVLLLLPIVIAALLSRFSSRSIDIGMGPEPLISYVYHKKALIQQGYSVETYVVDTDYITSRFDYNVRQVLPGPLNLLRWHYLFIRAVYRYQCLYFSFHGGPLMGTVLLRSVEPYLFKLANVRSLILPYGSDVQDMSRSPNLAFIGALAKDYPQQRLVRNRIAKQIDRWTKHADHIVSGTEWVDYMFHWDTLTLNNFSIDTDDWCPSDAARVNHGTIRVLHSPNHREIKGTRYFIEAIRELQKEDFDIELVLLERASNDEIKLTMSQVDIVADQLVIGWYAMFAMEGMALGKPVLCYIRNDLEECYMAEGLIKEGELPIVKCDFRNVKEQLRSLIQDREEMLRIGKRSRDYIVKHHSLVAIGKSLTKINTKLGIKPTLTVE